MLYNVFLDFLNRDSRRIYGLFTNAVPEAHVTWLNEAINVGILLCRDFCVMPPLFLIEDEFVQRALSRCSEFLNERLIVMPLREASLDLYLEKKEKEYTPFKNVYPGIFDPHSQTLLREFSKSLTRRSSQVGEEIATQWEEGPDRVGVWNKIVNGIEPKEIDRIRRIPRLIHDQGFAVTWPALKGKIGNKVGVNPELFRNVLQHTYFNVYICEYELRAITGLPFALTSFSLESGDLRYDYGALKGALSTIGLWEVVRSMSAPSFIKLRARHGYFTFRNSFDKVAGKCESAWELTQAFARGAEQVRHILKETKILDRYGAAISLPYGIELSDEEIDAVADRLQAVSCPAIQASEESRAGYRVSKFISAPKKHKIAQVLAVFVALREEREILVKSLSLEKSDYPPHSFAGQLGLTEVVAFTSNTVGRVPAALETMRFLYDFKNRPLLIIVAGIAGGFKQEDVNLGDIIVADTIIDLASRKIRSRRKTTMAEFRPKPYETDRCIRNYLDFSFDKNKWTQMVVTDLKWPPERRPVIHFGAMASVDEVVSSAMWARKLLKEWPKLLGVEMEAGGVCAAASFFDDVKVAVVRGVSDHADPAKSDTTWRSLAIETVAHLLRHIDYETALASD